MTASGGFQFGATAVADPATDPSITGTPDTASVTPTVLTLTKTYDGPESETATGPFFPRHYTVAAEVAPGQVVTNLRLTDALPDTIQFDSFDGSTPGSTPITTPGTTVPGGALARLFASVTGGAGADASFRFGFHVPLIDAGGSDVVDPVTGSAVTSVDTATAAGNWTPLDPRDSATVVTAGPAIHRLTDRSIAIQKSVAIAPGGDVAPLGIVNPGDRLQWTLTIQVSDFFAFGDVRVHDRLADGTRVDPAYVPTLDGHGQRVRAGRGAVRSHQHRRGSGQRFGRHTLPVRHLPRAGDPWQVRTPRGRLREPVGGLRDAGLRHLR